MDVRAMTLAEYIDSLPEGHSARVEYAELEQAVERMRDDWDKDLLKHTVMLRAERTEALDENATLTARVGVLEEAATNVARLCMQSDSYQENGRLTSDVDHLYSVIKAAIAKP